MSPKRKFCELGEHHVDRLWKAKGKTQKSACKDCWMRYGTNTSEKKDKPVRKPISPVKRKPTGEYALFLKLYAERKGICQITEQLIPFDVNSFAHILSKGAYPSMRLDPENILMVVPEIHHLYDNSSRDKLLEKYPDAKIIYELKENLKHKYYNQ